MGQKWDARCWVSPCVPFGAAATTFDMADITTKPLREITSEDVREFLERGFAEDDQLEFKQELPSKKGHRDPWMLGELRVGDYARNEILEGIVAFANAHGGTLVIGVEESGEHPKRGIGLMPLPRCTELAARLRLQARDCIEPSLPVLEIEGVPTGDDGSGVVLARVPQSRLAAHRLKPTLQCYVRRADRSEQMTMREIQDLTLQRAQGAARIEARFAERRNLFRTAIETVSRKGNAQLLAIRATALPVGAELFLRRVHNNPSVLPWSQDLRARWGSVEFELYLPFRGSYNRRPILRGTRDETTGGKTTAWREIQSDGLVEYGTIEPIESDGDDWIFPEIFLATVAATLLTAHRFRIAAGGEGTEYALDLEISREHSAPRLARFNSGGIYGFGPLQPNPLIFPRLSFGAREELAPVLTIVLNDLFNAAGRDGGDDPIEVITP